MTISSRCRAIIQQTPSATNLDVAELLVADVPGLSLDAALRHVSGTRRTLAIEAGTAAPRAPRARAAQDIADVTVDDLTDRAFGIEFEFRRGNRSLYEWGNILRPILGDKLHVTSDYFHSNGQTWDLKTDSTCGYELATARLTKADWPLVERVLAALQAGGARTGRTCGLHVHHEVRDYQHDDLVRLVRSWSTFGEVISQVLPVSRRNNRFCMPLSRYAAEWQYEDVRSRFGDHSSRYHAINVGPFWASGRVEVRQHNGTLDAKKTLAWLVLTQRMIDAATRATTFTMVRSRAINARPIARRFETLVSWARIPVRVARAYARRLPAMAAA